MFTVLFIDPRSPSMNLSLRGWQGLRGLPCSNTLFLRLGSLDVWLIGWLVDLVCSEQFLYTSVALLENLCITGQQGVGGLLYRKTLFLRLGSLDVKGLV